MAGKADGSIVINTAINSDGVNSDIKTIMNKVTSGFSKIGRIAATAFSVAAIVRFGKEAIELGSDLAEVQNVVDTVFPNMNQQINQFAKNAAESFGLSETMAKKYAGSFGAMADSFGFAEQQSYAMSTALTGLAGDVASFYNITQDEAYAKLKSVFSGETETLKDLGVVMTQSALDSYALSKGLGKTTNKMSEQEKVALRYSFVMDQLSNASGDFAKTSDSWANQMRFLKLNIQSYMATIGQGLINIFTPVVKALNSIFTYLNRIAQKFKSWTESITGKKNSIQSGMNSSAQSTNEIADSMDLTAKATKKINNNLSGLDEINIWSSGQADSISDSVSDVLSNFSEEPIDFDSLSDGIANAANEGLDKIDFKKIASSISDGISSALKTISLSIDNVDWGNLGKKIGNFIDGIKWDDLIVSLGKLTVNIAKASLKLLGGIISGLAPADDYWDVIGDWLTKDDKLYGEYINYYGIEAYRRDLINAFSFDENEQMVVYNKIKALQEYMEKRAKSERDYLKELLKTEEAYKKVTESADQTGKSLWEVAKEMGYINDRQYEFLNTKKSAEYWVKLKDALISDRIAMDELSSATVEAQIELNKRAAQNATINESLLSGLQSTINKAKNIALNGGAETGEAFAKGMNTAVKGSGGKIVEALATESKNSTPKMKLAGNAIGDSIKTGIDNAFEGKTVKTSLVTYVSESFKNYANNFINVINDSILGANGKLVKAFSTLKNVNIGGIKPFAMIDFATKNLKIPLLAQGAVIPPRSPFMAILGDQKRGTNIETPLETIKQAFREVAGEKNGSNTFEFIAQLNGKTLFRQVIDEGKLRQMQTGKNPFMLV